MSKAVILALDLHSLLMVPEPSQTSEELPILCFLHGYDEGAPTKITDALTRHGPMRPGNPESIQNRFIIIAPQLPARGDTWRLNGIAVYNIIRHIQEKYNGDVDRTYLTGFSFGANGVLDLALEQPGFWAAVWAVDPTRLPKRAPELPVLLSFGAVSRPAKKAFIQMLELVPAHSLSEDRIYTDDGADHVGSAEIAYGNEQNYAWLLFRRLNPP